MTEARAPLSPREHQILDLVRGGRSNAEISAFLKIGVRTVKFHLSNLFRKFGVQSRVSLRYIRLKPKPKAERQGQRQ